jgi:hypothetical protein
MQAFRPSLKLPYFARVLQPIEIPKNKQDLNDDMELIMRLEDMALGQKSPVIPKKPDKDDDSEDNRPLADLICSSPSPEEWPEVESQRSKLTTSAASMATKYELAYQRQLFIQEVKGVTDISEDQDSSSTVASSATQK